MSISKRKSGPLLINVSGAAHIGVTTACDRVQRCLNAQGILTDVLSLERSIDVVNFDDDYVLGNYMHLDVILFDKHRNTDSAIKRRLIQPLWEEEGITPDISILLTCSLANYQRQVSQRSDKHKKVAQHETYLTTDKVHYGTRNHHVVETDGKNGQLYAAGTIKSLILRELTR
ncbi:hypothetical protein Psyc_0476 [Psychrobacter arcticus 273-4]|uniref:Uncharacterized protein n=1 Tax=Psychrobacter arcticus (strain DSM 17307 / VKM B-2377 / 273-4) TaxID=259536 RepID=Q4FUG9_PSYA2|nr:hypothetical protein [Psychrobacter arcticus]AAZ18339.1 hypothetical protein Psyc_0476 [Psychrobacter arcticus 273-4]